MFGIGDFGNESWSLFCGTKGLSHARALFEVQNFNVELSALQTGER